MPTPARPRTVALVLLAAGLAAAAAVLATDRRAPSRPAAEASAPGADARALRARSLARDAVAREVAAGRLPVPAAAAVFDWLNRRPPATSAGAVRASVQSGDRDLLALARTEADLLCLQVIVYTTRAIDPPARRREELRDEYRRACAAPGGAVLPAVDEAGCRALLDLAEAAEGSHAAGAGVSAAGLDLVASTVAH